MSERNLYRPHPLMIDSGTFWRCPHGTTGYTSADDGYLQWGGCNECWAATTEAERTTWKGDDPAALQADPEGERIEGWASEVPTNCSCATARSWEFDADCGHKTTNRRATLVLSTTGERDEAEAEANDPICWCGHAKTDHTGSCGETGVGSTACDTCECSFFTIPPARDKPAAADTQPE